MGTLVENGIAMTDLKRANTLYDPIRREGKLIDLGGVIKVKNKLELINFDMENWNG